MPNKIIELPLYEIRITLAFGDEPNPKGGSITSNLFDCIDDDTEYADEIGAAIDTIYSILLAHALAGIDVTTPAYLTGVQAAVTDSIINRL